MKTKLLTADSPTLILSLALTLFISASVACQQRERETQAGASNAQNENSLTQAPDLSSFFRDMDGAIVIYDLRRNRYIRHNEARCRQRFSPKSTFKIANSLIGLESGVIRDANFVISWNREEYPSNEWGRGYPFDHWAQDHNLRSAFQYSVLWYYREIATRVGAERMQEFVRRLEYGNRNASGRVDNFWLDGTLEISADEQIDFLRRLYNAELPVSRRSIDIVKEIMVMERTPDYTLRAKTGGGSRGGGKVIGWFVGYVERGENVYFFALNIDGADFASIRERRIQMTRQILASLGYLPES
jgi:beta-lactamase class D